MGSTRESPPVGPRSESSPATVVARWIGEILAPPYVAVATLFFVAIRATPSIWTALGWGLLTSLFSAVLPYAVVLVGVARGHLGDRHLHRREDRLIPLLLGVASVLVGMGVVDRLGAPRPILATVAGLLAGLLTVIAITAVWKVSLHLAVASGAVVMLYLQLGPPGLWAIPALGLLTWARVRTNSHTVAQALVGTVVGTVVVSAVYALVSRLAG